MRSLTAVSSLLLAALPAGGASFYSAEELRPRIAGSEQLAVADLNKDGEQDLVFSSTAENPIYDQVAFHLNLGGGVYGPAMIIEPEMFQIGSLEVADVNGDGFVDVVAGSSNWSDAVGIRLYLGDGTGFTESQRWTNFSTSSIAFADLNDDTHVDLVYQYRTSFPHIDSIRWRPNNGSGVFGNEEVIATTEFSRPILVRNINSDRYPDVVAMQAGSNRIVWFGNNAHRGWNREQIVESSLSNMSMLDAGDLDRDNDVDLVLFRNQSAYIYRNDRRGRFTRSQIFSPNYAENLNVADINKDGAADILYEENSSILYRRNTGGAQFVPAESFYHQDFQPPSDMDIADVDGDSWPDIVATEFGGATIYQLRNSLAAPPRINSFEVDDNTVTAGAFVTLEWEVENATEVRVDGVARSGTSLQVQAGGEDTVFTLRASNQFGFVEQTATVFVPGVAFGPEQLVGSGSLDSIQHLAVGDLTGDGFTDVVFASRDTDDLGWFKNDGAGGFLGPFYLHRDLDRVTGPLVHDVDGDGALDVVAVSERHPLVWFRNTNGGGAFGPATEIGDLTGWLVKALDMNGDELPDLVVQDVSFSPAKGVLGDGGGNFGASVELGLGRGRDFEVHDWTGDGVVDLLWIYSNTASIFPAQGVLQYPWQSGSAVGGNFRSGRTIELFDFTGDGILDFIVGESSDRYVDLVHGKGSGVFDREYKIADVRNLIDTEAADFDLDGDMDVAFYTRRSSQIPASVVWIENDGSGNFSEPQMVTNTIPEGTPLLSADLDDDIDLDLVVAADEDTIHWIPNLTNLTAPSVSGDPGVVRQDEGEVLRHTGSFADSGDDTVTISADVGSVTQAGTHSGTWEWSHPPLDGPVRMGVTITATDSFGATRLMAFSVYVANVDPVVTLESVRGINEGGMVTLRGTVIDPGTPDTFRLRIDWGDPLSPGNGQTVPLDASPTGSQEFELTHRYLDDNPSGTARDRYTIAANVSDDDEGTGDDNAEFLITNDRPEVVLDPLAIVEEGGVATLGGTIRDAGTLDTFLLFVDWGDPGSPGNQEQVVIGSSDSGSQAFTLSHMYPDDNPSGTPQDSRTVFVLALDDEGASAFSSVPVVIRNSAPVLSRLEGNAVGDTMTVDIGITDPGAPDIHTVLINWGDGAAQTVKLPAGEGSLQVTHAYPAGGTPPGNHTVMVTVTDDDTDSVMGVVGPPPAPGSPGGIDKIEMLEGGAIRIGFSGMHGDEYRIEYSDDMDIWKTVTPNVVVAGNRVLWTDTGPPATESHPSSVAQRYYRYAKVMPE